MKNIKKVILILMLTLITLSGCVNKDNTKESNDIDYSNWDNIIEAGKDREVTIYMWSGNEKVNKYVDEYVNDELKSKYNITLKRVASNPKDYIKKLFNEKKANLDEGSADLLWINAENFKTARDGGILWGPFTDYLQNSKNKFDINASDMSFDAGIDINGYEALWGRAQLIFTYDSILMPKPPKSYKELLSWAKANPGLITYPKADVDFAGSAFVRNAIYELVPNADELVSSDISQQEFNDMVNPVIEYFKELNSYLWLEGESYPKSQAEQDELFKNGEIAITMGFEVGKTAGLITEGVYPNTTKTYVFDKGTIGNSHYLAIPYNSQNKAAALLVIDYLQGVEPQLEKYKSSVWGDMPAIDVNKLTEEEKINLDDIEASGATIDVNQLTSKRLPELNYKYISWIQELWKNELGGY